MSEFDLRQSALKALERAKELLQRDKYLAPIAFIVTADQPTLICGLDFSTEEEKRNSYQNLARLARAQRTLAVVTINDARLRRVEGKQDLEGYYPGKLRGEGAPECLFMAVKVSRSKGWGVSVEYTRQSGPHGEEIMFGNEQVFDELDVRMVPDWETESGQA